MSKAVLHMQKMKMDAVGGMEMHNDRKSKSSKNQEIDYFKSYKNYDFVTTKKTYKTRVKERISELNLKRAVRKDAVVFCSFIVSSDKDFFKDLDENQTRQFFYDAFNFFKQRYGEENIINATVHVDEVGAPHMHLGLVPVTADGRLSAKSLFDRKELSNLQTDYSLFMGRKWDIERGQKGSKAKHLDEVSFKISKRKEELSALEKDISSLNSLKEEVFQVKEELQDLKTKTELLKRDKTTYQEEIERQKREILEAKDSLIALKREKAEMEQNIAQIMPLNEQYLDIQSKIVKSQNELKETESLLSKLKGYIKNLFGFASDRETREAKNQYQQAYNKALEYFDEGFLEQLSKIKEDNPFTLNDILALEFGLRNEKFKAAREFVFASMDFAEFKEKGSFEDEFNAYIKAPVVEESRTMKL